MKNISQKRLLLIFASLALIVVLILVYGRVTSNKSQESHINPAFGAYISSYTSGVISSGSGIRIILSQPFADSSMIGMDSSKKLFQLSPSVNGKTVWLDSRTVEFLPAKRLISGQQYKVSFLLSKLFDVPPQLASFEYPIQVIRQDFDLRIENLKSVDRNNLSLQRLEGIIQTADYSEVLDVEKVLLAKQEGKSLPIKWMHSNDGRQHNFIIDEINRTEEASTLKLQLIGKSIGVDRVAEHEVEVPALGDFKLMEARVMHGTNQYLLLRFSDPLKEKQNLAGLIRLGRLSDLEFTIRDNEILVYPNVRQTGSITLNIESGIRNVLDYRMKEASALTVEFEQIKPAVRFTGKGNILPGTDGMVLPFEAVGLRAVDVEVIKIYEQNVVQFLQVNQLEGSNELRRVGKPVLQKSVRLDQAGITDFERWNRYTLDLASLINAEPGAIYQVRINFKKNYSTFFCGDNDTEADLMSSFEEDWDNLEDNENSYWDSYEYYYYDPEYSWRERDNPCHVSYYTNSRRITKNILASDLGIIAKRGEEGRLQVFITDIRNTQPISNVAIEVFNYQQQVISRATTNHEGNANFTLPEKPFVLVASQGLQRGYLRLDEGSSLSLSAFDVSGEKIHKGIKGLIYGERGVWRPGDSLHLSFMLEDKNKILPTNHPVVFELSNPQGQVVDRQVRNTSVNGIYYFGTSTEPDAITGNYLTKVKVGGTEFNQTIKIETVKPNRLKINLDLDTDKIRAGKDNLKGNLNVRWLHGAPARNLKAEFDVILSKSNTGFKSYSEYIFEDPSLDFYSEAISIIDQQLDAEGNARIVSTLESEWSAPGVLNATFRGKVFEESGDFSVDRFTIPFYSHNAYVGIRTPKGDKARGMLLTDTLHRVDIVRVDADGKAVGSNQVEVELYKLEWRWWWESTGNDLANYVASNYNRPILKAKVPLNNGQGNWNFRIDYPEWGRYFVRVCDPESGHCTGKIIFVDWPGWAGRAQREGAGGATMLMFTSDKPTYQVGEEVKLQIPGSAVGRALVSVENGSKVVNSWWVPTQAGETLFEFKVTPEMAPNVFVNVSLLQEHAQTINDLPIRLYGIIPITIENPETHLHPEIKMPAQIEPGKEVVIKVSEAGKRKMSYTIAVVDEGLLDLTRFKTPDPWKKFYAREALGVRTWDMYDNVIGAYGAKLERLLAIGGDEALMMAKESDARAQRFKPVVKFMGPFTLEKGKTNEHKFIMPQYVGSVKTMLVASNEGAYGSAEQVTPVRQPLMVLGTLPRVLGPEEKLKLPVTIFSSEASIKEAKIEVKVSGPLGLQGNASRQVNFAGKSDQTVDFDLEVASQTGIAKVTIMASSGAYKAQHEIEIEVRNPNLPSTQIFDTVLESGKSWDAELKAFGLTGSNSAVLEVSSIPPINLDTRMRYLLAYPHGCIEQTTSAAFPQLYISGVRNLSEGESKKMQDNVKIAISKLVNLQTRDGGFGYWPGAEQADSWSSTYAGHFLIEAENKGFVVPEDVIKKWKRFQKNKTSEWRRNNQYYNSDLQQAYRLYALALAGSPENAAMNRLRESNDLNEQAAWMLAAAYARLGQKEAAKQLITKLSTQVKEYTDMGYTYGSAMRDKAFILETLTLLDERTKAFELLKEISNALSHENYWMSTQTTAFCLKAVASFASTTERNDELVFTYSLGGTKTKEASTKLSMAQVNLTIDDNSAQALRLNNTSKGLVFARLMITGTPARGEEVETERNLRMQVSYTDLTGNSIDVGNITQGKSFMAEVTVAHLGLGFEYKNLALSQIFPSGWEISNTRMDDAPAGMSGDAFTYQDIRDDRVFTYFDLKPNQRKTFKVLLTATYVGSYYLPGPSCEAMYDNNIQTKKMGMQVNVIKEIIQ